jgi:hypothetical protein
MSWIIKQVYELCLVGVRQGVIYVNTDAGRLPRGTAGDGTRLRPVADSTRGRVARRSSDRQRVGSVTTIGNSSYNSDWSAFWDSLGLSSCGFTGAGTNPSDPSGYYMYRQV